MDDLAMNAVHARRILRVVLPLKLHSSLGHNLVAAKDFTTNVLREVTSLLSANQGETWSSSIIAIQMREKKVYVLWDLFLGGGDVEIEKGKVKIYTLTHTWAIGYIIKRVRYVDKFVEKEMEMMKGLAGGERPWVVDMYAGVKGGWKEAVLAAYAGKNKGINGKKEEETTTAALASLSVSAGGLSVELDDFY